MPREASLSTADLARSACCSTPLMLQILEHELERGHVIEIDGRWLPTRRLLVLYRRGFKDMELGSGVEVAA
jgi:hypothetical protein